MFKKELAVKEVFSKNDDGGFETERHITLYEVYIELSRDKDKNVMKNKDGSDRYFAIDDQKIEKIAEDTQVKMIREDLCKKVYQVNGDHVECVERDGKRIYYVVEPEKINVLKAGTDIVPNNNGFIKVPNEVGYVVVDDTDMDNARILAVRKFKTEDHKAEAQEIVENFFNRR